MARSNDDIARLVRQFGNDLLTWVGNSSDRAAIARQAMADVVSGRYRPAAMPAAPQILSARLQMQIDRVTQFLGVYGGGRVGFRPQDIPLPPVGVPEDELLLAVYLPDHEGKSGFFRTLDTWFDFAGREGRPTWRNPDLKSESTCVRLRCEYRPGVRWVRFLKNHDAGKSATYSRQRATDLAGLEPLMAVSLIDGYFEGWFRDGNVAPNLSGIEVSLDGGKSWDYVAYLSRWGCADGRRGLGLYVLSADDADPRWGSPLVSEC